MDALEEQSVRFWARAIYESQKSALRGAPDEALGEAVEGVMLELGATPRETQAVTLAVRALTRNDVTPFSPDRPRGQEAMYR